MQEEELGKQSFEELEELLDDLDDVSLDGSNTEQTLSNIADAIPRLQRALTLANGSPEKSAETCYHGARLLLALSAITKSAVDRRRALDWADRGLGFALASDAPLLEAALRTTRGSVLLTEGHPAEARPEFESAVRILEPHVGAMRDVQRTGTEAERFTVEFLDRRIHAATLLADAQAGHTGTLTSTRTRAVDPSGSDGTTALWMSVAALGAALANAFFFQGCFAALLALVLVSVTFTMIRHNIARGAQSKAKGIATALIALVAAAVAILGPAAVTFVRAYLMASDP